MTHETSARERCNPISMKKAAIGFALIFAACGGKDTTPGGTAGPTDRTMYPVAPYGTAEGGIIENHTTFKNTDGTPFSLNDVFKVESNKLMLVSTTAEWCTACIDEQPTLAALHTTHGSAGLVVVVSIFEDMNFRPADERHADPVQRASCPCASRQPAARQSSVVSRRADTRTGWRRRPESGSTPSAPSAHSYPPSSSNGPGCGRCRPQGPLRCRRVGTRR